MKITVRTNFNLGKLDIGKITKIGLVNSTQELVRIARENAPYATGTLKKSIGAEPKGITENTKKARIWPRRVVYAVRREFENKKNPHKKYYMQRTANVASEIVKKEFELAVAIVEKSIKK